ncbi:DUF2062 domain-containing protein [Rhizobium sp. ARZ01]|uniref:DUF2062 domain-containing protein n=1 Tax=Rhizobium sp. ARZ01 TaxID=2769313 RepID=UPI00177B8619|nr:DUF2062 domain-containing protein [Rhizobium sp. ARZ01]MBD9371628.1 DUF2062 domain-containing protein [Rhizobium sp. ARZ01]
MLFRRRKPATWRDRVREFFWPRKGLNRPFRYLGKRILRLSASPHAVAIGVAAGTLAAFTPFLGLHVVVAVALAYALAGNLVAAALSTAIANPLTLPFIWAGTYEMGELMLGTNSKDGGAPVELAHLFDPQTFRDLWGPVLEPMLFGSLALGLPAAIVAYATTRVGVEVYRRRRRKRFVRHHGQESLPPAA